MTEGGEIPGRRAGGPAVSLLAGSGPGEEAERGGESNTGKFRGRAVDLTGARAGGTGERWIEAGGTGERWIEAGGTVELDTGELDTGERDTGERDTKAGE